MQGAKKVLGINIFFEARQRLRLVLVLMYCFQCRAKIMLLLFTKLVFTDRVKPSCDIGILVIV